MNGQAIKSPRIGTLHLQNLPNSWKIVPVWALFELGRGRVISHEEIWRNQGDYPVYSSQTTDDGVMGFLNTYDFDGEYLTWTTDGANAGTVFYRNGRFNCTNVCGTLKSKHHYIGDLRFFRYAIDIATDQFVRHDINPKLMNDVMAQIEIQVPSPVEQKRIADYLDWGVAKIDALVAAMERLLVVLAEKRQAVITHAVTRGLDPDVPLRDSGVEWIGRIPAHWDTQYVRWLFEEVDHRSTTGTEELLTVSHLTGVTPRSEKDVNMFMAESLEGYKKCMAGDLVINTLWAWMGAMGVALQDGIVSPAYNVYRSTGALLPEYIDRLVRMRIFAQEVTRYSKGVWSSRLRLYPEGFFEAVLPVPPIEEQQQIVNYLKRESDRIDSLHEKIEVAIKLLQERRISLISAAVTGQIRVNGKQHAS